MTHRGFPQRSSVHWKQSGGKAAHLQRILPVRRRSRYHDAGLADCAGAGPVRQRHLAQVPPCCRPVAYALRSGKLSPSTMASNGARLASGPHDVKIAIYPHCDP